MEIRSCDCYLRYFKRWLESNASILSSEKGIRCYSPTAFSEVTLNIIDEEPLTCDTRSHARKLMTIYNIFSSDFNVLIKGSREMSDPSFIKRSLLYGPLKCINCFITSLSGDVIPHLKKYSTEDLSSAILSDSMNIIVKVNYLFSDTHYAVSCSILSKTTVSASTSV